MLREKKLFTTRTFSLALCARPLPPPLRTFLLFGPGAAGPHGWRQRGHVAPGHFVRMAGASMAGMLWVIWVIWVMVLNCKHGHACR